MRPIVTDRVALSVGRSVGLSVGLSVCHTSEPCKTAEMPFGLSTRVGPRNHVLDGASRSPMGRDNFEGEGRPIAKYRDTMRSPVRQELIRR